MLQTHTSQAKRPWPPIAYPLACAFCLAAFAPSAQATSSLTSPCPSEATFSFTFPRLAQRVENFNTFAIVDNYLILRTAAIGPRTIRTLQTTHFSTTPLLEIHAYLPTYLEGYAERLKSLFHDIPCLERIHVMYGGAEVSL